MPRNTTSTPAVDSARAQDVPSMSENATLSDMMTTTARRYLTHCGYPSRNRCIPSTPCVKRSNPSGSDWHTSAHRGRRSYATIWPGRRVLQVHRRISLSATDAPSSQRGMTKASTYGEAMIDIAFDMLGSFVWELFRSRRRKRRDAVVTEVTDRPGSPSSEQPPQRSAPRKG